MLPTDTGVTMNITIKKSNVNSRRTFITATFRPRYLEIHELLELSYDIRDFCLRRCIGKHKLRHVIAKPCFSTLVVHIEFKRIFWDRDLRHERMKEAISIINCITMVIAAFDKSL